MKWWVILLILPMVLGYSKIIDEAWNKVGYVTVYTPGVGLQPYTTVYPPVTTSSATTGSLSTTSSTTSSVSSGKAVYGASSTCTQTTSTLVKGQSGNSRLDKYADEWSKALVSQGLVGTTWIGVMDHNGKTDNVGVTHPGRLTIIFTPCTTNFNNPIEVMYYWHGIHGFGYSDTMGSTVFNDFNKRIAPQSKSMSMAGRNFVLVFPEMPWSGADTGGYSQRNARSRQYAVFDGDDSFALMHSEALRYIQTPMGAPSVGLVSVTGHSRGGLPLKLSAENGQLAQVGVGKITVSDADYYTTSQILWDNYVSSRSDVELNLLVTHQDGPGAHTPTYYTLKFLQGLGDSVTSSWVVQGSASGNTWSNKGASTPGATMGEVFNVPSKPNINYYPLNKAHKEIGSMSLSFVAPSRTFSGDCPLTSGNSASSGSTTGGTLTGATPITSNQYLESHSVNDDGGEGHHWGTVELVNMLEKTACELFPVTNTKLTVQDLSEEHGGKISGHQSHRSGRDADTGIYYYEDGQLKNWNKHMCTQKKVCTDKGLKCCEGTPDDKFMHESALEANYRFIKSLNANADIRIILLDQKLIDALDEYAQRKYSESSFSRDNMVRHWANHYHHYHIRINCPSGDTECHD